MKFSDILALAKQGYTPSDIKELLAINMEEQQHEPTDGESPAIAQEAHTDAPLNEQTAEVQSTDKAQEANAEKIEALENEIRRLKEENIRISRPMPVSAEKSVDETLADLARGFM